MNKLIKRNLMDMLPLPWEERDVVWRESHYTIESVRGMWDAALEGYLMGHCLGTKEDEFFKVHRVFSIRDDLGISHATILAATERVYPYGGCNDFGSSTLARINGEDLHLLQVRGRNDDLARLEYHTLARKFWTDHGGQILSRKNWLDAACMIHQDADLAYHYRFVLNEAANRYTPHFWNQYLDALKEMN